MHPSQFSVSSGARVSEYQTLRFARKISASMLLFVLVIVIQCLIPAVKAHPAAPIRPAPVQKLVTNDQLVCRNENVSPFDYSVKIRVPENAPRCPAPIEDQTPTLFGRQITNDDYSCSETKPCSNGACCSKKTGYCNYGVEACGSNGQSPNDVCWSNCDAHAECGRYADPPGKECPLNVCCGPWGFCGMTPDFCTPDEDITKGCQSNCEQPGSGKSGGNVQDRIIGYYEAWAHDRSCTGMDFRDIPVGSLTHLYFSFGYISPGSFEIAPMDGLPFELFTKMTDMKKFNPGLKCVVALGGWTFNDPGPTQFVFSNMVSTPANRKKAIINLLSFMRQYAFDGVDFDWEYPGADDRGGIPTDGINFTQFLKELHEAIAKEPENYIVSYTIPTSYWYLRHFDLKSIDYVDFVNIMSYDLHGTWDSNNPIGNNVLGHTNLTEIKLALDLLWRNKVDPGKLNLGIGFYGRSFQLSDPACFRPGCKFLGGAAPGACTANSGTLSYKEIMQIIDQYKLVPFYDRESEVKYIVWNQDQWVSYDDEETMKAKIKFANDLGLGGLLIWSVDQDTADLSGLKALVAPKALNLLAKLTSDAAHWQDLPGQDCYVTGCGAKSCNPGYTIVTHQPCGGAQPVTRHSKEADSLLCCPITSAPDPKTCRWRGGDPSCNGHCHAGEVALQMNKWGDGWYCEGGHKVYCCDVPTAQNIDCYWTDGNCNSGDILRTFKGTFLSVVADIARLALLFGDPLANIIDAADIELSSRYCCKPEAMKQWKNCNWYGRPGSCDDNHCNIGHQVQLTDSKYGAGESCFPRMERTRVFCCDPADGASLFPPVPLKYLFPDTPGEDDEVQFDVKIDNTWGDGVADTPQAEDPDRATFGFWVMTSPEEIQVSLDKRDGSHWELIGCDTASHDHDEPKTIQMICTDMSKESNCDKIYLGHGVPGTIVELPKGCGPSKYAVAKSLEVAKNQSLPLRLAKRYSGGEGSVKPLVYDFTFDFEWARVPRDLGDTQVRVDYSNEVGYWDNIVEKAAANSKRKVKRSLEDTKGNHRRWLEDEWRDDYHLSSLSKDDLHKRWFGSDVIDWLRNLLGGSITQEFTHKIEESFTAILVKETWPPCKLANGITIDGHMDIRASAKVSVATSFGFTLIAKLDYPNIIGLGDSYLYFKNRGEVSAIFTMDAEGKAVYMTGDKELFGLQNFPGATFSIPKLLTVGPNFKLYASAEADVTLKGHLEARVDIANWDVQQTYPNPSGEYNPKTLQNIARDMTLEGLKQPTFDYSLSASGQLTAHLKPTFEFGITFDKGWSIPDAKVSLVADGWMRMHAKAELSSDPSVCPFVYGIDVGADLYVQLDVPPQFSTWNGKRYDIAQIPAKQVVDGNTCPQRATSKARRSLRQRNASDIRERGGSPGLTLGILGTSGSATSNELIIHPPRGHMQHMHSILPRSKDAGESALELHALAKRGMTIGPLMRFPASFFPCPNPPTVASNACADIDGWADDPRSADDNSGSSSKRSFNPEIYDGETPWAGASEAGHSHLNNLMRRAGRKTGALCVGSAKMTIRSPEFWSSGEIVGKQPTIETYAALVPDQCNDFTFGVVPNKLQGQGSKFYATEHILEFQLIAKFIDAQNGKGGIGEQPNPQPKPTDADALAKYSEKVSLCHYLQPYYYSSRESRSITVPGFAGTSGAIDALGLAFPSKTHYTTEWSILHKPINTAKESMWDNDAIADSTKFSNNVRDNPDEAIKKLKDVIMAVKYHNTPTVVTTLRNQADRVGNQFETVEGILEKTFKDLKHLNDYKVIGLKGHWNTWIKARWLVAKKKADSFFTSGLKELVDAHGGDPEAEADPNIKRLMEKIKALAEEIENVRGTMTDPWAAPAP